MASLPVDRAIRASGARALEGSAAASRGPVPFGAVDERELACQVRAGSTDAFEAVFRAYYGPVLGFVAGYVGGRDTAEEVVQELFFAVWEARATFALEGSVRAYLYRAARNRALNARSRWRLEQRWAAGAASDLERGQGTAWADGLARGNEVAAAIARATARLPEGCRTVFVLSRQHGLTIVEIADALGMSVTAVKQQLWRALSAMRRHLVDYLPAIVAGVVAARAVARETARVIVGA